MTTTTMTGFTDRVTHSLGSLILVILGVLACAAWLPQQPATFAQSSAPQAVPTPALAVPTAAPAPVPTAIPAPTAAPVVQPPPAPPVVEQPAPAVPVAPAPVFQVAPATPEAPPWYQKAPPPADGHGGRTNEHAAPEPPREIVPGTGG